MDEAWEPNAWDVPAVAVDALKLPARLCGAGEVVCQEAAWPPTHVPLSAPRICATQSHCNCCLLQLHMLRGRSGCRPRTSVLAVKGAREAPLVALKGAQVADLDHQEVARVRRLALGVRHRDRPAQKVRLQNPERAHFSAISTLVSGMM